tara:strand:+ start:483 stop:1667 length:1185 start_codon:yes stop_codon:yes gene_type:complete
MDTEFKIKRLIDSYVGNDFPGCNFLITQKGKEIFYYENGYADLDTKRKFTRNTIIRLASMTKALCSFGAMLLIDRENINVDDPVEKYIPEFKSLKVYKSGDEHNPILDNPKRKMTIRDLMSHQSGLPSPNKDSEEITSKIAMNIYSDHWWDSDLNSDQFLLNLSKVPLLFSPGDAWNYGPSIDVLGFIVERVSGKSLDEFLKENIFDEVGMVDTGFILNDEQQSRLSDLYDYVEGNEKYKLLQKSKNYIEKSFYSGGGGGYSTIEDYSKFCSLILNKGEWNGRKLLSEKSFNLLISNQLNNKYIHEIAVAMNQEFLNRFKKDGTSHALGFAILENPNDYGWGGFYSTIYRINLELNSSYIMMPQIAYPFPLSKRGINLQSELRRLSYQLISENN